jgi:signal transduction histidine kinase
MRNEAANQGNAFKALFYKEEFKGERLLNKVRFFLALGLLLLLYLKEGIFTGLKISGALWISTIAVGIACLYSLVLFFVYKKEIYHPILKYISVTIEIGLVILNIFSYRFEPVEEAAKIFFLARYALFYIFIYFTIYRFSFILSLYSGILAGSGYYFLIVFRNPFAGLSFFFRMPDGAQYASVFDVSEGVLKAILLVIAGFVTGIIALAIKGLVINSIRKEQDNSKLITDNKVFEAINTENKKYLDNITNGLLLIDKEFTIQQQYSKKVLDIFETTAEDMKKHVNFVDFIFPDLPPDADEKKELAYLLNILFYNTISEMEMIMEINPLKDKKIAFTKNGSIVEKVINATFHRIYRGDEVENIMVLIEDRTQINKAEKELEAEKINREMEIEYIAAILNLNPGNLSEFLRNAAETTASVEMEIPNIQVEETLHDVFRQVHSLKGSARTLGFSTIADQAHLIEDVLASIRDDGLNDTALIQEKIKAPISSIYKQIDIIIKLYGRFKAFSNVKIAAEPDSPQKQLSQFYKMLDKLASELSKELDKSIKLEIIKHITELPCLDKIKQPIIHLVNNAIDHGIEDQYERLSKGKETTGCVTVEFTKDNTHYIVAVKDDGRGLDFDAIRNKAIEKRLVSAGASPVEKGTLLKMIFKPGFSTRDHTSKVSGRGVGLDVVMNQIVKLKGKISVSSEKDKWTKFILKLPRLSPIASEQSPPPRASGFPVH